MCPLPPDLIDLCHLSADVHKVDPPRDVGDNEQTCHGLVHVVKVVVLADPFTARGQTVPFIQYYRIVWGEIYPDVIILTVEEPSLEVTDSYDTKNNKKEDHYKHDT